MLITAGETMHTAMVQALLGLVLPTGTGIEVFFPEGASPVVAKRNELTDRFLRHSAAAWALFLDTDMTPEPDLILRLLATGKDVVGALYFARFGPPHPYAGWHRPDGLEQPVTPGSSVVSVDWVAAGALLVRRTVLEGMQPPWFVLSGDGLGSGRNEDMGFCANARAAGHQVWCDTNTIVGHLSAPRPVGLADYHAAFAKVGAA